MLLRVHEDRIDRSAVLVVLVSRNGRSLSICSTDCTWLTGLGYSPELLRSLLAQISSTLERRAEVSLVFSKTLDEGARSGYGHRTLSLEFATSIR